MYQLLKQRFDSTLSSKVLLRIGIRVAIVISLMTAIAYYHVVSTVEDSSLEQLEKYIVERTQREREIFKLAEENHVVLKEEMLRRLAVLGESDPINEFNDKVVPFPDGTLRTNLEGFDGSRESFVFIGQNVEMNADRRRRIMTFLELGNEFGNAWHHKLQNVYFSTPENMFAGYWPEFPNWAHSLPADMYMPDEEYVWVADKKHNPSRESVWTGLFYDIGAKVWMVSLETPVDVDDRQIATIGHDITLNELLDRTVLDHLEGAYNLIIRKDGRLIAHPQKMDMIKAEKGYFDVKNSSDEHLKGIYQVLQQMKPGQVVLEHDRFDEFLAVGELEEPGWYFVTVYPRKLITGPAFETASIVLFLGIVSLIVELIIFYLILGREIAKPLGELSQTVGLVADGQLGVIFDTRRKDELGTLGETFNLMSRSLQDRDAILQSNASMSKAMTRALSHYVTEADSKNNFNFMLEDILSVTESEYGFIGEILETNGKPFLKTYAISDISWDEETRKLYDDHAKKGMEFHNLDTLFGAAIRDEDVVISNDPEKDRRSKGLPEGHPSLDSFLGVPLFSENKMIGLVGIANRKQGYDQAFVDWLNPLLQTCASVINALRIDEAYKSVKDSTRMQATIIDQIHDSVISTDLQGNITSWNKGADKIFGYTREEMLGKHIASVYPEEEHEFLQQNIIVPLKAKGEHDIECRMRHKSGEDFWAHLALSLQYDDENQVIGMIGYTMDITEKRNAEKALQESEERFRLINSRVPGIVYQFKIDSNGKRTLPYVSPTVSKYIGLSEETVTKDVERWFGLTHPDDLPGLETSIAESMQQMKQWDWEGRFVKDENDIRWLRGSSTPTKLDDGSVLWNGVFTDVTDQRLAEREIEQSRAQFEAMFESIPDAMIYADPERKIQLVNDATLNMFGYGKSELIGNKTSMLYASEKDYLKQGEKRFNPNAVKLQKTYEISYLKKNGNEFLGETLGTPVKSKSGNVLGYVGIIRDVSERSQVDAILRSLAAGGLALEFDQFLNEILERLTTIYHCEYAFIGLLQNDGNEIGTIAVRVNGKVEDNFNFGLEGTPCQDILNRKGEIITSKVSELYPGSIILSKLQVESYFGAPLIMSDDSTKGIIAVMSSQPMDIDEWTEPVLDVFAKRVSLELEKNFINQELHKHQEQLEELVEERTVDMKIARDEAERANSAKSEFLSRMSHELRTPLNAILGFGQLMELNTQQPLTEQQAENVSEIQLAGHHLLALVNDVLDITGIESGHMKAKLEPVDIMPIVKACVSQLQQLAKNRNINIEFNENIPWSVYADETRLKQVLINLLSNAVKYNTDNGNVKINCIPSKAKLKIEVLDSGLGIAEEDLPRLFKPFERLTSAQDFVEGTGIGLALAKKLVEAMHGNIGVESVVGRGSKFWFQLPLSDTSQLNHDGEHDKASIPFVNGMGETYKVLYIEDNFANLRLVQKILENRNDIQLIDAANAEDGFVTAEKQCPDLILVDINLPGMDGYELLDKLKDNANTHNIPLVAVTANAMNHDVEKGKAAGFDDYITKPLDIHEFSQVLNRFLMNENHKPS